MSEFIQKVLSNDLVRKITGFSITGVFATILSVALLYLFNEILHFNAYVSYELANFLSILFSYISNALVVWKTKFIISVFLKYVLVYCSSMALGALVLFLLKQAFPSGNDTVLSLCTMPVTITWNFIFVNKLLNREHE